MKRHAAKLLFILVLIMVFVQTNVCLAHDYKKPWDTTIGEFNITENPAQLKKYLLENYGKGYHYKTPIGPNGEYPSEEYCYYDAPQKAWLEISFFDEGDINFIDVSKKPLCKKKVLPAKPFKPFVTSQGVGLGDTKAIVLAAYGKPCIPSEPSPTYGNNYQGTCVSYQPFPWWLNFNMKHNRVQSIFFFYFYSERD